MIRIAHVSMATEIVLGLPANAIGARCRSAQWAQGRQLVMWYAHRRLGLKPPTIAKVMGRDPSTVAHGIAQVDRKLAVSTELAETIEAVELLARSIAGSPEGATATIRIGAPICEHRRRPRTDLPPRFPPNGLAPAAAADRHGEREWYEHNHRRFVAVMRAIHPEREVRAA